MILPVELRHKIHQNPELALQEFKTTQLLKDSITSAMANFHYKIKIHRPLETGLLVEYKPTDGVFTLLRADIDALPTIEQTGCDFSSLNENMHACGHDVHTAILYGFLLHVLKNKPQQNMLFLFQPAEEAVGGAQKILETGILDLFNIEKSFALHVNDEYEKRTIATNGSTLFASSYELNVEFFGNSAHVAFPQNGKNALSALRMFMDNVDKLPQNYLSPILFGVGKVESGKVRNIVPDFAKLEGTIRSFELTKTQDYIKKLETILEAIKISTGVAFKITHGINHKEVINSPKLFELAKTRLAEKFAFRTIEIKMTGEDYGFIAERFPSLMMWLGSRTGEFHGLHHPKFLPDDSIIEDGIEVFNLLVRE
ncbi:MAG: amidohydrolase [Candidatus Marinimicrobia bacterium]|nr:amidohydrolase [Candidatus Neomarinimicrobiota bacterium]